MKPYLMGVHEVMERLGVSKCTAYNVIKELNEELEKKGLRTINGKVHSGYFEETFFASINQGERK